MQPTIVPGVATWSRWQADRSMYFNSWFVEGDGGNFVVDPLEPDDGDLAYIDARGLAAVVITNRDHERAAAAFVQRYEVPVIASQPDAAEMTVQADRIVAHREHVFGWQAIALDGFKTAGEFALVHRGSGSAITGDALWGVPAGAMTLMPDEKLADPARAALSIRQLLALRVRNVLVGDGMPVFGNGWDVLVAMLDARRDAFTRRVNLDELERVWDPEPVPPFDATFSDIGLLIGAKKLGYVLALLKPGDAYAPYHWHTAEEEILVVWRGTASLRTPQGTFALRPGDVVAFPTGAGGAHRLTNDGSELCEVMLFANADAGDVCFYPDSRKLLVEAADIIVRSEPELDYYDGEL